MEPIDYWKEGVSSALEEVGVILSDEQLTSVAKSMQLSSDNYGQAFYSPPPSDRIAVIEREWKEKLTKLNNELMTYRENAETAIKKALGQFSDTRVEIGEHGRVLRIGGRIEQIQ